MDPSGKLADIIIGPDGQRVETEQLEQIGVGGEITVKHQRDIEVTVSLIDIDVKS